MKIDMYQQVPEGFHSQLMETLDRLPEEKNQTNAKERRTRRKVRTVRKWAVLGAAAVLALGAVTVTASEIFKWQRQAKERFGVTEELEGELTLNGVSQQENMSVESQGLEIQLLQSVRTERSCYYLCRLVLPEKITVDEDTVFERVDAESDAALGGVTANLVLDPDSGEQVLLEVEVLLEEGTDYTGQTATVHLSNLVQTEKTEITGVLLEGEWELPLTLLGETGSSVYRVEQNVRFGNHEVRVEKIEASPFELRVYMDQEEAQHALTYCQARVTGIRNTDSSVTMEQSGMGSRFGYTDEETGAYYCRVELEQAIDPAKLMGLIFNDGEMELSFTATGNPSSDTGESGPAKVEGGISGGDAYVPDTELPGNVRRLYQRFGHEIVTDGEGLYIHDMTCGLAAKVLDLKELDYDQEKGGEIVPFSRTQAYILPYEGCGTVYVFGLAADENGEHALSSVPAEQVLETESYRTFRENMLETSDGI